MRIPPGYEDEEQRTLQIKKRWNVRTFQRFNGYGPKSWNYLIF